MPQNPMIHEGMKFMWDGCSYQSHHQAAQVAETYAAKGFKILITEEENGEERFLVYTRRIPQETAAR